ncbi:MAG: alpha/beta hydrolase family protein [Nakamurella sp.]
MALIRCDFYSDALNVSTSMAVLLPERTSSPTGMGGAPAAAAAPSFPVLYLLHGLSDDHTAWLRRTALERYVDTLGLAVVMPSVSRSFYTDEALGLDYWTFLADELPTKVESMFRVSDRREDRFVAGLSMGGYGAMKWALRRPDRFAAAASLSGALDLARIQRDRHRAEDPRMMQRLFADGVVAGSDDDLLHLLGTVADPPALYVACGTEDYLVDDNHRFVNACAAADVELTSDFGPGAHDWAYWDATIQDVLAWLPLGSRDLV